MVCVCMYIKILREVCKVLTGAGLVRKILNKNSAQLWHTLQLHVLPFQFLIMSLKVLRFSLVLTWNGMEFQILGP